MLFRRVSSRCASLLGRALLPALVLAGGLLGAENAAWARTSAMGDMGGNTAATTSTTRDIALEALPKQGQVVYAQIHQGGPFAFDKDGTVFGNYERLLPRQARGYYREYTVAYNAASRSRGPRRIVCGGQQPSQPEACYYSADHYNSFLRITPRVLRPSERIKARQLATP